MFLLFCSQTLTRINNEQSLMDRHIIPTIKQPLPLCSVASTVASRFVPVVLRAHDYDVMKCRHLIKWLYATMGVSGI